MSASLTATAPADTASSRVRASFSGLLRGELRKLLHLRIARVLAALYALLIVGSQLLLIGGSSEREHLLHDPLGTFYVLLEGDLSLVRVFSGIILLILAAYVVGLEYQLGTIRILLARGVGRLQLLAAKVTALMVVALALIAGGLLIEGVFGWLIVTSMAGSARPWIVLGAQFRTDVAYYLFCVLLNAAVTLMLGVAASVVGRSLSFGLAVGLSWFAVDNLARIPLSLLAQLTKSDIWEKVTGVLLGPILNRLPDEIAPPYSVLVAGPHGPVAVATGVSGFGLQPMVAVSGGQALLVVLVYAAAFTVTAVVLTHRRDVLE